MVKMDLSHSELCVLSLAVTQGIGPVTIHRLIDAAQQSGFPLRKLLARTPDELARYAGLTPGLAARIANIESPVSKGKRILQELTRNGVRIVFESNPEHPPAMREALGHSNPSVLFIKGCANPSEKPAIGVVGSRAPSPEAAESARQFAQAQSHFGRIIVSGGARGIDSAAHRGALSTGGSTAIIPPTGVMNFKWRHISAHTLANGSWCLLGQFPPHDPWRSRNALQRNRSIVAMSRAILGFEPRDHGGTWHSCITTLKMRKPLFVVGYRQNPEHRRGLKRLVRLGAVALDRETMPTPAEFEQMVQKYEPPPLAEQLSLFPELMG
ncbi:MAG: DNA-processing protein DprA [Candidatus Brocadiia bacterium]